MAKQSRRFGFTLVELLVVIGIIAILVGVLLPALSRALCPAENVIVGQWPQYKAFSPASDKCLVVEANLWLLWLVGTAATHTVEPLISYNRSYDIGWDTPGWNNIDRYRHGQYPPIRADGYFDDKKGRVGYNMLFGDGHVVTLLSIKDGFRAIQMRDP